MQAESNVLLRLAATMSGAFQCHLVVNTYVYFAEGGDSTACVPRTCSLKKGKLSQSATRACVCALYKVVSVLYHIRRGEYSLRHCMWKLRAQIHPIKQSK